MNLYTPEEVLIVILRLAAIGLAAMIVNNIFDTLLRWFP